MTNLLPANPPTASKAIRSGKRALSLLTPIRRSRSLAVRGLCFLPLLFALTGQGADAARPNILFAFADDWGRHASAYARIDGPGTVNDALHTPHFDRVAREGVLFRHAFVSSPSCTPCRSALLSGQHFWRTRRGAILLGAVWDPATPVYPLLLRDAGYHLGKSYKVWSPGTPADAPYGGQTHAYEKNATSTISARACRWPSAARASAAAASSMTWSA